ncbi:conserved hypothetical integral membrane protein [Streptomyces zhaozhouensis]|uniref:Conserved hypothetical integral membrane protein n=1 Tax=Streptomyces zhaozhouensis TaxID=1300267 RepID=A0A286DWI9_9ACTN|nr:putative sulfate exporter family transporter [Streptomyces zhaozhouensis]SOD63031.1 conserved hypothetical integral membrane protein [Streptomyces zhaozhouensis]
MAPPSPSSLLPGVALAGAAAAACHGLGLLAPGASPLLLAIALGAALAHIVRPPARLAPGLAFCARNLLRAGIVLLGLRLALSDIAALGAPVLAALTATVAVGLLGTVLLGRLLAVPHRLTLLIACGFSLCGAAAVAGAAGALDRDERSERDTVTAVALVVVFGTALIPLLPLAAGALGLAPRTAGLWAGGSVHEVAQVVAVGGVLGDDALTAAVLAKLARVLLLAPAVALLAFHHRSRTPATAAGAPGHPAPAARRPPPVPLFVVGFLAAVLLRSLVPLPAPVLDAGAFLQSALLTAAMFALGCGVHLGELARVGPRPFLLAALSTLLVLATALLGVTLAT